MSLPEILTLTASSDRRLVAAEVSSQRAVEWVVAAPRASHAARRAPLNIALVLDRSGSMHGEKLRSVQQAARHVLAMLDERDRVALVAYDDTIDILSRGELLTTARRGELLRRIDALQPGGWTDLSGGWLAGCREVAGHLSGEGVGRALLLTDGMANRGITDSEALAHHARELRQRGVATSTFGVGLDFSEQLLEAMAGQGGGHFYYIERPDQIPGGLLTVVAREAFLALEIPRGVSAELLGDLPHERVGARLRIFLGDIYGGERRSLFTRIITPPDMPGTSVVLRGELGYAELSGRTTTVAATVAFSYAREAEVLLAPVAADVLERAGQVELAAATAQALQLERAGQRRQAQALLQQTLAAAPPMPAPAMAQYQALAEQLGDGLDEAQRKATHFAAYQARQSRG